MASLAVPLDRFVRVAAVLCCVLLAGCRAQTPLVPRGEHPDGAVHIPVTEPPPPTKVEVLPIARRKNCRWLDGHYTRADQSWRWVPGTWVRPPQGCYYAPPTTRYEETNQGTLLVHRPGAWFPERPNGTCDPIRPCDDAN